MPNDDANRNTKDRGSSGDSRFTPGPWVVEPDGITLDRCYDYTEIGVGTPSTPKVPSGRTIAMFVRKGAPRAEAIATAHLIAAAPDLFAALAELESITPHQVGCKDRGGSGDWPCRKCSARAALAKALPHPSPDRKDQP